MTREQTYLKRRRTDQRYTALWSVLGYHNRHFTELVRRMVSDSGIGSGSRVLDYGCAESPYRDVLPAGADYVGADLPGNENADVTLRADGTVPLEDETFDLILSTQVLEHVEDPGLYLSECRRLLRPGGKVVVTTHGIMYYHKDPVDHWRWTRTGLSKLVASVGLEPTKLYGMMGLAAAALQIFQDAIYRFVPRFLRKPYGLVMQAAIALFDKLYSDEERIDNGLVLAMLATKPASNTQ
jgi:SAM-dependent methyltransferase